MRINRHVLCALFAISLPLVPGAAAQDPPAATPCEVSVNKEACEATCGVAGRTSDTVCGTAPTCGASATSCGTITTFGFDPARNADGAAGITPQALGLRSLDELIEPIRAKYRVPALAVAVARSSG